MVDPVALLPVYNPVSPFFLRHGSNMHQKWIIFPCCCCGCGCCYCCCCCCRCCCCCWNWECGSFAPSQTIPKPSNPGENGWRVSGTSVAAMVTLIGHLMQKCGKSFPICRGNIWKYVHELRLNFKSHMDYISKREMLVCGLEHFSFFHILGMSSSQLTFIFFRGVETTNQNGINMWIHVTVFGVSSWRTRAPGGFKKKICPDWILP